jgi:hypothetical protein
VLTIVIFWVLLPATLVALAVVHRPRTADRFAGHVRTPAVVEPRSHVRLLGCEPVGGLAAAPGIAPIVVLADHRARHRPHRRATRHSA